jgi:hypothetical protein
MQSMRSHRAYLGCLAGMPDPPIDGANALYFQSGFSTLLAAS